MRKLIILFLVAACADKSAGRTDSQSATQQGRDILPAGESRLPVPGGNVWYKQSGIGRGTPVILLHGGPGYSSFYLKPIEAIGDGENSTAVWGRVDTASGENVGVRGEIQSPGGVAGLFIGTGGSKLLSGRIGGGAEVFFVDGAGNVRANDFTDVGGNQLFAKLASPNTFQDNLTAENLFANSNITAGGMVSGNFFAGNEATFANSLSVGGGAFTVDSGGNVIATSVTETSSRRWKQNIRPLSGALAKVTELRGVAYESTTTGKTQIGVIAEEVGAVLPEVVTYEENGVDARGVDYARLTALLIEAVKEQQELIRRQQERIQQQEARLEMLQGTLDTVLVKLNQNSEEVARLQPKQ